MRRLLLATMLIATLLSVGCSSVSDSEAQLENTSENVTDTQTLGESTADTEDTSTETEVETSITQEENTTTIEETSTDTDSTTTEEISTADTDTLEIDSTDTEVEVEYSMPIPTSCESSYITQEMCSEISEYFQSMLEVDVDSFQSKQLSAYNTFMENYLSENDSNLQDMLSTYCDNFLKSNDDEDSVYTDFAFNSITLEYPNDVDSILNTMNYIDQLDEVTSEQEGYVLSTSLTAYYQLNYAIDYTLTADGLDDYNSTKSGSILVLDVDGDISLIMLS
jgi:hypothetical protein